MSTFDHCAVVTRGLRKTYRTFTGRKVIAVNNLDLDVPAHGVHGFLGPNGSGKTTTIRMLLGLIRADSGTMEILGRAVPKHLAQVTPAIGAIVEQPKFYPHFSGYENLRQLSIAIGVPAARVHEVIDSVGLTGRAKNRYAGYSLGMKQRLAVAATLLKDPDLLIFDEPTNGLDPAGIREIRGTMRSLADAGKTVIVSSHILSEVELVADTVSIIGSGSVVAQGRVTDLLAARGSNTVKVTLRPTEIAAGLIALQMAGYQVRPTAGELHVTGAADPARVNETLARNGLFASGLTSEGNTLEALFLELTAGEVPGGGAAAAVPSSTNDRSIVATAGEAAK
ncbi:ABC transporter ATP-binding protein [Rarobacter incanus]|uniref:ABC-2 type transport system ATP-binding protein n=1 Tax=Rarobacter incanus TaxID=153494 RepID=A0A542SQH1_9MICO|nr:ATP-binding cassette domain-containing protein [Rarobacter incanus]TQK76861.1 ABC-2 type transport system ATP-binding protein [Rarobacter incanus]